MHLFPIWAGARQNLQSMLEEIFRCFSSTRRLFVRLRAVACAALLVASVTALFSASFFLDRKFTIAERGLFLAENLSPQNNHP